jgi:hypothetical protein
MKCALQLGRGGRPEDVVAECGGFGGMPFLLIRGLFDFIARFRVLNGGRGSWVLIETVG